MTWDKEAIVLFRGPIRTASGHIHEYREYDDKCKFCQIERRISK